MKKNNKIGDIIEGIGTILFFTYILLTIFLLLYYIYLWISNQSINKHKSKPQVAMASTINNPENYIPSKVVVSDTNGVMGTMDYTDMSVPPGTIVMWAGTTIPYGWEEIFSIPNSNGTTSIIRGRMPVVRSNDSTDINYYPLGALGGTENYMPPYFVIKFIRKKNY